MKRLLQKKALQRALWILLIALAWQGAVWCGMVSPLLLPGLGSVMQALYRGLTAGQLPGQIAFSLAAIAAGMLIAALLALLLSALAIKSRLMASLADTLSMLAHPLPAIALMPVIIVWFGLSTGAVIAVIVHAVLWPMLVNLTAGFRSIPRIYTRVGESLGLHPLKMLFSVYLPSSAPYLISGVRIGWARAWRALISAEMVFGAVGGAGGVGWYIFKSRVLMDPPGLFAGIIVVMAIGAAVEGLMDRLERGTVTRWGAA